MLRTCCRNVRASSRIHGDFTRGMTDSDHFSMRGQVRMMDKLALEMETFEEILERFEVDVKRAKECGDYSQMVRPLCAELSLVDLSMSLSHYMQCVPVHKVRCNARLHSSSESRRQTRTMSTAFKTRLTMRKRRQRTSTHGKRYLACLAMR